MYIYNKKTKEIITSDKAQNLRDNEKATIYEMKSQNKIDYYIIDNQFEIYLDGVIYDTASDNDIPQEIFLIRDFLLSK